MAARIDREDLRSLVRQALKDALGEPGAPEAGKARATHGFAAELRAALAGGRPAKVAVAIRSGADLDRFARDLIDAAGHADLKAAVLAGDLPFELAGVNEPKATSAPPPPPAKPPVRGGAFR